MTGRSAGPTRRIALTLAGAAAASAVLRPFAWAAGRSGLHALSIFGEFRYPPGFKHFDYVNPTAPKGGRINFQPPSWAYNQSTQTFNTLNGYVQKGDAPPRIGLTFASLMAGSEDEPATVYGYAAESVAVSEDLNTFTFTLRPEARFHDGSPLTAADVAWSLTTLKDKGHAAIVQSIDEMVSAEAPDPRTVVVTLNGRQNKETILVIAGLPIFSKASFAGRAFEASTLDPLLGSGPYRVGRVSAGRFIEYERVPDIWSRDLPVAVGQSNFDVIRIDFYRERQTAFEAFKKGDTTYREEFTSRTWATEYNFPAVVDGRVRKTLMAEEKTPDMQGYFFNTRRPLLADPRTRQAIGLAFDFEWTNRNLFYGLYARNSSFFEKSDFAATGAPSAEEIALLEPFRSALPPEVFAAPYVPPVSDGSGRDRRILRQASELLAAAGWKNAGGRLADAKGTPLEIEFLIEDDSSARILSPFIENLKLIGVGGNIRQVDPSQYQSRLRDFQFDVISVRYTMSATPLDGPRQFFSAKAADIPGSYNLAGIKSPAIDALLDRIPAVASRAELLPILRAIDRVLRAGHYWVPAWHSNNHRVAHWELFGWPEKKPDYGFSPEVTWWFDRAKAAAAGRPEG